MVITLSLAGMDREGFFTGPGSKSAGRILRISTWNHVLEQWKPWFALICEDIQIYPTFIIMIAIMITIIVFHCGFPELERFESVTFIVPRHCPAFLPILGGRSHKGVSQGGVGRPSLIAMSLRDKTMLKKLCQHVFCHTLKVDGRCSAQLPKDQVCHHAFDRFGHYRAIMLWTNRAHSYLEQRFLLLVIV